MLSYLLLVTLSSFVIVWGYAPLREPRPATTYNDAAFIQDAVDRMSQDLEKEGQFFDLGNRLDGLNALLPGRSTKDIDMEGGNDYDLHFPSIRDHEYLQQSSLWGNKYMSGGAAESQRIKGLKTQTEVKTDAILPAYCNPPNPCPVGQTTEDGCIENFENTAAFSRAYQASQECMCDTEHMFDCQPSQGTNDADLDLSQHDFLRDLQGLEVGEHKNVMAKKFYNHKISQQLQLSRLDRLAKEAAALNSNNQGVRLEDNPYLLGEQLPIAAKKGNLDTQSNRH